MININNRNGVEFLTFDHFNKHKNLIHAFTTRNGGVSEGCYKSLNFGFNSGDKVHNVKTNYKILGKTFNINNEDMVLTHQTHSANILSVYEKHKGQGVTKKRNFQDIDGFITNVPKIALLTSHADCASLFFYDQKKYIIGLAHSGWRGTVKKIGEVMVKQFIEDYNSNPQDIIVGIGPSIGQCCFEVDKDVYDIFINEDMRYEKFIFKKKQKYHIDLWRINMLILTDNGILNNNIISSNLCTVCNNDIFFSHRGQKGKRGIMLGVMMLK